MKKTGRIKGYLCLSGIFAAALTAAGCGKKSPLDPGNPVSLTVWHYYNGSQQAAFDALVEEFNNTLGQEDGIYMQSYSLGSVSDLEEAVRDAIRWHTTGRADMSLLEKIIYLADYIEPTRCFDGVETLRKLCYEDIDSAMELGLRMTMDDLAAKGVPVLEISAQAYSWFKNRRGESS